MRLSESELLQRGPRVRQLLGRLSRWEGGPAWERRSLSSSTVIIGTHDGSRPTSNYRDWRFTIRPKRHNAMYFEAWTFEAPNQFVLGQAYLNIYETTHNSEREIICLHCD